MNNRSFDNNPAPWARTPPADRKNILREAADKLLDKKAREVLQELEEKIGSLHADGRRLCEPAQYEKAEAAVRADETLTDEQIVMELAQIKARRDQIPQFQLRIGQEIERVIKKMAPPALSVLKYALERTCSEIASVKPAAKSEFWGIEARAESGNWLVYPLERLRSILEFEVEILTVYRAGDIAYPPHHFVRGNLIDAGVIEARARRDN